MKKTNLIKIRNNSIDMPLELYNAMMCPKMIGIIEDSEGCLFLYRVSFIGAIKSWIKSIFKRSARFEYYCILMRKEASRALFGMRFRKLDINKLDREYFVANYARMFYLMPIDAMDEHKSREKAWASYKGYHEHRTVAEQDESAKQVLKWLSEIFRKYYPKSILELGCGGGRNLIIAKQILGGVKFSGIDINQKAIEIANKQSPGGINFIVGSIYELQKIASESFDIVFTAGVLMHIPHEKVEEIIKEMHRISKVCVINFELHGPSHAFDYHRYPRDYKRLYEKLGLGAKISYEIFPKDSFQSAGTNSFNHALLISKK